MGYTTCKRWGGEIQSFWPDDGDDHFYITSHSQPSLAAILIMAQERWPGIDPNDILIEAEHIHTDCIGYDLYDPGDYTNFIRIGRAAQ